MKTSSCKCGNRIYFENTQCQQCQSELGFLADEGVLSALVPVNNDSWQAAENNRTYRKCHNYVQHTGCNWMVGDEDNNKFCLSCRLSEIIPDLSKPENVGRWNRIEQAKRRLIYSLFWLGLPIVDKKTDSKNGLSFRLMEDHEHYSEFATIPGETGRVFTGHLGGTITLNIEEADTILRDEIRSNLQERYRTLLGHLRHESGHYYWDQLVRDTHLLEKFRALFGDERRDYQAALQYYYSAGPIHNWQANWVSAYASSHPWEDWAECWAHYLHMIDAMETAYDFGEDQYTSDYVIKGQQFDKNYLASIGIKQLIEEWSNLSVLLNEMNRSLGLADAYPFYISYALTEKLTFVHEVISAR